MEAWGPCFQCQWWQIEPDAKIADATKGLCIDDQLQPYKLLVSGDSGCNRFIEGAPVRARGSSAHPPWPPRLGKEFLLMVGRPIFCNGPELVCQRVDFGDGSGGLTCLVSGC